MENAQLAFNYFVSKGWTPVQAAGIVGNLMQESGPGLDINVVGDSGTAFGIAQWRGDRLDALQAYAAANGVPWQQLSTQLAFVDQELRTTESRAGEALRAATTVDGATAAMIGYERPAGWTAATPQSGHGWSNRLAFATQLVGGSAPTGAVPSGGTNPPEMAENSAPEVVPNPPAEPETPIQAVVRSIGQRMAAQQPAAAPAPEAPEPSSPLMAASDLENSRSKLGQMRGFLLPEPETVATAPQGVNLAREGSDGPLGGLKKPDFGAQSGFSAMFRGAKPAPLGGGIKVRGG